MFRAVLNPYTSGFKGLNLKIAVSHRAERVMIIILHSDSATSLSVRKDRKNRGLDMHDPFTDRHTCRRVPLSGIPFLKVRISLFEIARSNSNIFARRIAFSIPLVEFYRGSINRSCDVSSGNPSIESPRKHCVAIKLTRGSASGMRTHHRRPVGLSGPVFAPRSIGAANRWCSLRVFFEKPGTTFPVSLFTPHREMYTNELVINFSMADGAAARPCVSTGRGPREWLSIVGTIDASRRNSQSEFPGYFAT